MLARHEKVVMLVVLVPDLLMPNPKSSEWTLPGQRRVAREEENEGVRVLEKRNDTATQTGAWEMASPVQPRGAWRKHDRPSCPSCWLAVAAGQRAIQRWSSQSRPIARAYRMCGSTSSGTAVPGG